MARRPLAGPAVTGSPDELEAEFYEALQKGDIDRLMAVWADDDDIVCVHPGGARVIGVAAVRASFEAHFARGGIPAQPTQVHRLLHLGCALHHVVERVEVRTPAGPQTAWVLATNVYVKTVVGWRLAAHHASPGSADAPPAAVGEPPALLH